MNEPIDEVRLYKDIVPIVLDPLSVQIDLGLSCGHDYRRQPIDGSPVFEVICLSAKQVTVVDIDDSQWTQQKMLETPGYIKGGSDVKPDAYVLTGRGVQLVFLQTGIGHALQDPAYERISREERGWWGMRTHDKLAEEQVTQPYGKPGRLRQMVGLTNAGRQLAEAWNAFAQRADEVRQKRIEAGATHVQNGQCLPDGFKF